MKKIHTISLALLLAMLASVTFLTFSANAVGEVYTIGDTRYVFLGAGDTVEADLADNDGTNEVYNTYSTLKEAIAALGTDGGVCAISGEFTDPTTNGDSTFSDVSGRGAVTIKGIGDGAALIFHHTLAFTGETTLENFKLYCRDPDTGNDSGKYVRGGGNTTFGPGMTTRGSIYYSNVTSTQESYAKTVFNCPGASFVEVNSSNYSKGKKGVTGTYELIFDDVGFTRATNINLGAINGSYECYGNVNLYVNGGTFVNSPAVTVKNMASGSPTGIVSVIFNNGMAEKFGTIADSVDYVIKSGTNGRAEIKTQADGGCAPCFRFIPDDGYYPAVNGVVLLANNDKEYVLTPELCDSTSVYEISYIEQGSDDSTKASFYSVNGVKTAFVKAGGGADEYNGSSVVAFDTIKAALTANTGKEDITVLIIGESTSENFDYPNIFPSGLLTISGADENSVLRLSNAAHPWGNVLIENIKLDCAGSFCADGNRVVFSNGLSGNMPTLLYGGGSQSHHGGNIEIYSGKWNEIIVGSTAATSETSSKTQCHNMTVYGGDFTEAVIDFGSTVETTVPKNMIFTVNGGDFAENQEIKTSNITSVGGISAVIYNNGMADKTSLTLGDKFEYTVKSGENGAVAFDGTEFVIKPDEGYAAKVNGALCIENSFAIDENTREYTVEYIKATGKAEAYTVDGIKTAYVKTGGGLVKIDGDGKAYYAFEDIREAVAAAAGGRVCVAGEYTGALSSYWSGSGTTTITAYDDSSVLTLTGFYMWTPIVLENIKISGDSGKLNADSRPFVIGEGVEVTGNGLEVYGSTGAAARSTDVTIKSGKYKNVIGGNVGSESGLSITLDICGGDFSEGSVNLGNTSANTLNGNALLKISGGVFADGQEIKYSNLTTNGNAIAVITNDVDKTYNLKFADAFDAVVKIREGGTYEIDSYGSSVEKPTFIFTPENPLYAPVVNGTMVKANASGKYYYTPEASDNTSVLEVTWTVDTMPKAYEIDGVLTAFLSSEATASIGENNYYTFETLTEAVAALGGKEGKIIIASDVTNTGGDGGAFVDTANREPVVIEGLSGSETLTLDGTFGFKGDVVLDKFTLAFTELKYINGFGNTTFGKDFKISSSCYFAPVTGTGTLTEDITVNALGGTVTTYNAIGAYRAIGEEGSVISIVDGMTINTLNVGYAEKHSTSAMSGAVNIIINSDTVTSKKITLNTNKNEGVNLADGVYTLIFNNGIEYTVEDGALAILDYLVYSGTGGKVTVLTDGTKTSSPVFLLAPDDGYTPRIAGKFIEEKDGKYIYTPDFSEEQTTVNVEWVSAEDMYPVVYEIDGERYAFARSGGGVIYYENDAKFAFADINSAIAALGTEGGNIKVYGNVQYVDKGTIDTNIFADVSDRSKVTITGIDGTEPCITYYRNAVLSGDLEVDNLKMHRLSGTLYDTGFITNGFELILGEKLVTTTDFSQNITVHGVSGHNLTFTEPQVITIKGGTITRVLPGTTWSASTVNGDSVINIEGGTIDRILGGSHGGQNYNSIINGDVEINISGGNINSVYTGGNVTSRLYGNVTVNISGGKFNSSKLIHGNYTDVADNVLDGNSAYIISGGEFIDVMLGNGTSGGTTGEEIFIINNTLSGFSVTLSDKGTVVYYDPDGTVKPAFGDDGSFLGYEIICNVDGADIVIDGEKAEKNADNIYTIPRGEHTVLFSTLWNVEFDLNGAEGTVPESIERYNDTKIALVSPEASKKNHFFNGWSTDKNAAVGSLDYTVPNADSKLYAIWTEIKPEETEDSNIENSDAERIEIISVSEDKYDTHSSVIAAKSAAENDAAVTGEIAVVYAFSLRAFDNADSDVAVFPNGINLRIPKYVLPERQVGEFYRIYHTETTSDVSLASENSLITDYTEDDDYLYLTAYTAGDYTVILTNAVYGEYLYKGEYDNANGKYTLVLSFKGAEASYGSFGLKYNAEKLTLDSFTFSEAVTDMGSIAVADGGFGTYYNQNGIYQNTWAASNGVSIEAQKDYVKIGTFVFTAAEGFTVDGSTFAAADLIETGIALDEDTLETVYSEGMYLYVPCVPSTDVYCQPITVHFDVGVVTYAVNVSYTLAREYGSKFFNDTQTGYNNAASVIITNSEGTVFSTSEDMLTAESDENGMTVLKATAYLADGTYTITFAKNGYVKTSTEFTVNGNVCEIGNITPVGGDIKADFDMPYGDGVVDIDDFIRVLRGFDNKATDSLRQVVDIDESGTVNVSDLAIVKKSMMK